MSQNIKQKFLEFAKNADSQIDLNTIEKAYDFAAELHKDQVRYSGEPYIIHPVATARNLINWKADTQTVIAGLLHDTLEDANCEVEDIIHNFGTEVAHLVDGVTKVSKIRLMNSEEAIFLENLRKMIVATSKDPRVLLVKLSDRLHNMYTLRYVPQNKQHRIARETLEIYSPLAERLGMGIIKRELEDLAFPFVYPLEYKLLVRLSAPYYQKGEKETQDARNELTKLLTKQGLDVQIDGRTKGKYSLYKKLQRPEINRDMTKINDIVALRVIINSNDIGSCYVALGLIHSLWKPVPWLPISDYIAQPKPNGYQSIHLKVFRHQRILEIQIRTQTMHQHAELGVAAHWYYDIKKNQDNASSQELDKGESRAGAKLNWVKQLVDIMHEIEDNKELIHDIKFDFFKTRIFVFTPLGDVIDLPDKSTPVDFAFSIHTDLGNYIKGAKVNGKMVPLHYQLRHGDVCEIIKNKSPQNPPQNWSNFVVTSIARSRINRIYKPAKVKDKD